jgi:hypothetical protein
VLKSATDSEKASLTPAERNIDTMLGNLEQLLAIALYRSSRPQYEDKGVRRVVTGMIRHMKSWFSTIATARQSESDYLLYHAADGLFIPGWNYFHSTFLCLDLCRFAIATLDYLLGQENFMALLEPNFLQMMSAQMKESIGKICQVVRQHAVECRQQMQAPETIDKLSRTILGCPNDEKDPVGKELREFIGEPVMNEIGSELIASWVEALNGISDIKVF